MDITELQPISVFCFKMPCSDPSQIGIISQKAFHDLESRLPQLDCKPDLKGRKTYGTYLKGEYHACVTIKEGENAQDLGLDTWEIPGGKYARAKIQDWKNNTSKIGESFDEMAKRYKRDQKRPLIEFYRSQTELIVMVPIV